MTKKTKQTYYSVICPVCGWKVIGNWKEVQLDEYEAHFKDNHYQKPIIKSEKR